MDGLGNFYLSSVATNLLYKVPATELQRARDGTKNTKVFARDDDEYALENGSLIGVDGVGDSNAEKTFPCAGDLTVDGVADGVAATRAWVLGVETGRRCLDRSRVYAVNLSSGVTDTYIFEKGVNAQKLYLIENLEGKDLLVVAGHDSNKLYLFDVSGSEIEYVTEVSNPE